jgi:hypothetical protein
MSALIDDVLPSALDCRKKAAEREAEKASDYMRAKQAADAEKKGLLEKLSKPSGVSDEERMERAASIINRAVTNGLSEVEVARFPNRLFSDKGRAINQQEAGWENSLTGLPKELHQFWDRYLKQRGYRIKFQIADWPDGMPGDISITLSWADQSS